MSDRMQPRRIASVVEGHGELQAAPVLLRRLAAEIAPNTWVDFPSPYRISRNSLLVAGGIERVVDLVVRATTGVSGVLVLLDADDDCPAGLGPDLLARAQATRPDVPVAVVLPNREFEAWFLAAAVSLAGYQGLAQNLEVPPNPERPRGCKEWLSKHRTDGQPYRPKSDQAGLAATFDLHLARANSPSFDKLWRDVEYLISGKR
ncbi:DUF4276 family protein [Sphaerisporangium aureirubrum]|uniref:DUF4276 family protein n=1 Tax=Sphaerisporangium aureirubrum TaxID=1544736 RepID=A0ABW1NRQ8_9ACTN